LALVAALVAVLVATAIGLVVYWPEERTVERPANLTPAETEAAKVVGLRAVPCRLPGRRECQRVTVELESGPDEGTETIVSVGDPATEVALALGDEVRVFRNPVPRGAPAAVDRYSFADFERRQPLLWLAVVFALLVLVTGRWQGLRALVGLAGSLLVVIGFIVPAILDGASPSGVALFGALAVMFVTIPLAHGFSAKTITACLGTTSSLVLTLVLAETFIELAHLTGFSSEEAVYLRASTGELSIEGLMLAGMVIGALGVLDDLTVTQASTVLALRRANPTQRFRELFGGALSVGHDHIAATVNTLFLAYAGASLPILLVFNVGGTSFGDAVNGEAVAEQIVAMLVGSIGLIAAVPVTRALAALLASRLSERELARSHAHAH